MLVIRRNQNNKMVVSVSNHKTIANPNYLFSFQHILSKEQVQFFPKNISNSTDRYDEFEFNEGIEPVGYTGDVPYEIFPYPGQYYYSIYECFTDTNTNPHYAFDKLEEGRAFIEDDSVPDPYEYTYVSSNENNSNYIYYTPGTNEERITIAFQYDIFNTGGAFETWRYAFPSIKVQDLETGVIETIPNTLTGEGSCGEFNRAVGELYHKEITTGSTWAGFKMYMDETEVISKGYGFEIPTLSQQGFSGITFYNFREGFIPPLWSVDYIQHNTDGTETTGTSSWAKVAPLNRQIATISGNSDASYSYSYVSYTGSTFQEACDNHYAADGVNFRRIYYTYSNSSEYWWNDTGTTSTYSLTDCIQTKNDSDFFVAVFDGTEVKVASASTEGNIVYYDTCIPPTPTPTPTSTITPTPSITPTLTPTSTITPTPTETITPTPTITPTSSLTPTPTPTITPSPTPPILNNLLAENSDILLTETGLNIEPEYYPNQITLTWDIDWSGASGTYDYYADGYILNEDYYNLIIGTAPNGNTYKIYRRQRVGYSDLYLVFREDVIPPFYSNNFNIIDITNELANSIYDYSTDENAVGDSDTFNKWFMKQGSYKGALNAEFNKDFTITYN